MIHDNIICDLRIIVSPDSDVVIFVLNDDGVLGVPLWRCGGQDEQGGENDNLNKDIAISYHFNNVIIKHGKRHTIYNV